MMNYNIQFFGGRGAGGIKAEHTTSYEVKSLLSEDDVRSVDRNLPDWTEASDYGGSAMLNKMKSTQRAVKSEYTDMTALLDDFNATMASRKLSFEEDREKYYKDMAALNKRAQKILLNANETYRKIGAIMEAPQTRDYVQWSLDKTQSGVSKIIDTVTKVKRAISTEAQAHNVYIGDNGKIVKYDNYKPLRKKKR